MKKADKGVRIFYAQNGPQTGLIPTADIRQQLGAAFYLRGTDSTSLSSGQGGRPPSLAHLGKGISRANVIVLSRSMCVVHIPAKVPLDCGGDR